MGTHFGAERESIGELVFTTGMTGYQEAITDPSYAGQILTFSYPLIGNYGINKHDWESEHAQVRAVVVREICHGGKFDNYLSHTSLSDYLSSEKIPGICNVDTRAIVRKVREYGVMPAAISKIEKGTDQTELRTRISDLHSKLTKYDYGAINFVEQVSLKNAKEFLPKKYAKKIALIDCGVKMNIVRELNGRNIGVIALPFDVPASEILKHEVDGFLISNGPGDPKLMGKTIGTVKQLMPKLPLLGICLGHQIIGHALGGTTYKLKFGHRGSNHAVLNPKTGKIYITTQNHGYSVKDVPKNIAEELFTNCNDGTNEGLRHKDLPVISSQFHPEGSCGPKDANFLFDEFVKMLK